VHSWVLFICKDYFVGEDDIVGSLGTCLDLPIEFKGAKKERGVMQPTEESCSLLIVSPYWKEFVLVQIFYKT
jgi:hypothetical protein